MSFLLQFQKRVSKLKKCEEDETKEKQFNEDTDKKEQINHLERMNVSKQIKDDTKTDTYCEKAPKKLKLYQFNIKKVQRRTT